MEKDGVVRDGLVKPKVAAGRLGIAVAHLYAMARAGEIESVKFAKAVRFDPGVIEQYIEAHRRPAAKA
jgi:hypothetical protein